MKRFLAAVVMLGLASFVYAAESETNLTAVEATTPAKSPALDTSPDSAVADEDDSDDDDDMSADDAGVAPISAADPVVVAPVVAPAVVKAAEPVKVSTQSLGCVVPLQALVAYHEKEIVSLRKMMGEWNTKIGVTLKRRQDLKADSQAKFQKATELEAKNTKDARKEAAALKKEAQQSTRDIQSVDRDLKNQCRELSDQVRAASRDSQQAFRDNCQAAVAEIQKQ